MTINRNITFDIIKAIGILLVIIGHLADNFKIFIGIIYIFHMPLFFIVSGYFFKKKEITKLFKRDFHSLVFPYLLVALCLILYGTIIALFQQDYNKFKYWLDATLGEGKGPLWFLLAMFWCRMFYNILHIVINKMRLKRTNIVCLIITFIPFALIPLMNNPMKYNILCWLNGVHAMFYYSIGACIKEYNIIKQLSNYPPLLLNIVIILLDFVFILITIKESHSLCLGVNMADFKQNNLICNIGVSILSFLLLYFFSQYLENELPKISKKIAWYGRLSLVVFCMHTILFRIFPFTKLLEYIIPEINIHVESIMIIILHITITVLFCKIVEKYSSLKYLFNIK